jgi:hypothetical protein
MVQEILKGLIHGNGCIPAERPDRPRLQILSLSGYDFLPLI